MDCRVLLALRALFRLRLHIGGALITNARVGESEYIRGLGLGIGATVQSSVKVQASLRKSMQSHASVVSRNSRRQHLQTPACTSDRGHGQPHDYRGSLFQKTAAAATVYCNERRQEVFNSTLADLLKRHLQRRGRPQTTQLCILPWVARKAGQCNACCKTHSGKRVPQKSKARWILQNYKPPCGRPHLHIAIKSLRKVCLPRLRDY